VKHSFIFRNPVNIVKHFSLDHALQTRAADFVAHLATDDSDGLGGRHDARRSVLGGGGNGLKTRLA